jgi:hypothetical protein
MKKKHNAAMYEAANRLRRLIEKSTAMSELLLSDRATEADLRAAKQLDEEMTEATASFKALAAKVSARDRRWMRMLRSRQERQREEQWARYFGPKP